MIAVTKAPRGRRKEPPPPKSGGLLAEDYSEIKIVKAEDREWYSRLDQKAKIRVAERFRKRWTDEETGLVIQADPSTEDYYELAARMGRTPGSIRIRRSAMVHLLRDEYDYVERARAYERDPKTNHKWADIGQVQRVMRQLGLFDLNVAEQFALAKHLQQPHGSWRGDNTGAVLRHRRANLTGIHARVQAALARGPDRENA